MALRGYATGALGPGSWERATGSAEELRRAEKPEKGSLPASDLDGDLIGEKKLRKVIDAAEGVEQ